MKLTPAEKELIRSKRIKDNANKPKKKGILAEDIYKLEPVRYNYNICNSLEKEKIIEDFRSENFKLLAMAGTEFVCYISVAGTELWYDNVGYGIEAMSSGWARKYLVNIEEIK